MVECLARLGSPRERHICQLSEVLVYTPVSKPGDLNDERCRHDLVIFGAHLNLGGTSDQLHFYDSTKRPERVPYSSQDAELFRGDISKVCGVKFHRYESGR